MLTLKLDSGPKLYMAGRCVDLHGFRSVGSLDPDILIHLAVEQSSYIEIFDPRNSLNIELNNFLFHSSIE